MALVRITTSRAGRVLGGRIDWANPLTKGLAVVLSPQAQHNLAVPFTSGIRRAGPRGIGFVYTGSSTWNGALAKPVTGNTWTIFADLISPKAGAPSAIGGLTNADFSQRIHLMTEAYPGLSAGCDLVPYAADTESGVSLPSGQCQLAAVVSPATNTALVYLNGRLVKTVALASTGSITMDTFTLFYKPPYGDVAAVGLIVNALYVWTRDLRGSEIAALSANPSAILSPAPERYVDTSPAFVTVGLAATFQARATATAAASVGKTLAAPFAAVSTLTANLSKSSTILLSAAFAAQVTQTASLQVGRPLAAAFASTASMTAAAANAKTLSSAFSAITTMVSLVTLGKALSSTFVQDAQVSATPRVDKRLGASVFITATFTAYLESLSGSRSKQVALVPFENATAFVPASERSAVVPSDI